METQFAPAERYNNDDIFSDFQLVSEQQGLRFFLDAIPIFILILNEARQIVFANESFLRFIQADNITSIIGQRPGETLKCTHSYENEAGCGTSEFCRECGAVKAVLESRTKKSKTAHEARISILEGEALDILVWATPYHVGNKEFTIAAISDISSEKRKRALERIFFHDVMNTAGALKNYQEIIQMSDDENEKDYLLKIINSITMDLIEELQAQKNLVSLESGEYELELSSFMSKEIILNVKDAFKNHSVFDEKEIKISHVENIKIHSDRTLIRRILFNLAKNALEATKDGESISIGCSTLKDEIAFHVNNPGVMPKNVKLQIFQRSFSTKGSGRGLGTYSVKLLTERYLKGRVYFESSEESGTTFYVIFPFNIK